MGATQDHDRTAATDPRTPPHQLADLAARRWDLHALIAAHPQAYAELRQWMDEVNPAGVQQLYRAAPPHPQTPRARRRATGWWVAGCGCLAIVGVIAVIIAVIGAGALLSAGDGASSPGGGGTASGEPVVDELLAEYEDERARYHALAAQLEGNPVAPLVTDLRGFQQIEEWAAAPAINEFQAQNIVDGARAHREALEARIAAAETRRTNASGTVTEELVDSAGDGFIDIGWDAQTACSASANEDRVTAGCVSDDPLGVHILPEDQLLGDWGRRMVVLHELAHLYQRADLDARPLGESSAADLLREQGLFQGSSEKMADCYALTYLDEWTLSSDQGSLGYGYVCDETERRAIREWAAEINAPMPG